VVKSENEEIRDFLLQHMELRRYQALSDLDETELTRLLEDANEQARELLATQGFFNPQLSWQKDRRTRTQPTGAGHTECGHRTTRAHHPSAMAMVG
jgi:translocation and assembly module TamA